MLGDNHSRGDQPLEQSAAQLGETMQGEKTNTSGRPHSMHPEQAAEQLVPLLSTLKDTDGVEVQRQSLNVHRLHRGSLAHLGLDAAQVT